jgi:hypothetical protein
MILLKRSLSGFEKKTITQEHKRKAVNLLNGLTASVSDKGIGHKTVTIQELPSSASL